MAKVLVCEDDFMMLRTIEHRIKMDGHEVITVTDGAKAIEVLKVQGASINLIITDLLMPYMSGLELINSIRAQYQLKTPIIVLSKVGNEDTVLQAFELGADDYLTKPFSPNELSIRVKKLVARR
jgi:two-component system response regulator VicR